MTEWKKSTISISEIIYTFETYHPNGNIEAAKEGTERHRQILGQIGRNQIPGPLGRFDLGDPITTERAMKREIALGLKLSVKADIATPDIIIDLKPRQIRMKHMLQVATCCACGEIENGGVFIYDTNKTYLLRGGGKNCWPDIAEAGVMARRILDIQDIFDKEKPKGCIRNRLGQEVINLRDNFDRTIESVIGRLRTATVEVF